MEQKVVQKATEQAKKSAPNLTGIPTQMKLDFEHRSGLSFDDVRVHYNSDKPRKIGALAYTQIPQVHIGPGQERHLRHELGHVVQQKQGIVRPTTWINGLAVNDSPAMEREAELFQQQMPHQYLFDNTQHHKFGRVLQGYFNFIYGTGSLDGKYWSVSSYVRPGPSKEFTLLRNIISYYSYNPTQRIGLPSDEDGNRSLNHIIPAKYIMETLKEIMCDTLNDGKYVDNAAVEPAHIPNNLKQLILAVIPEQMELPQDYRKLYFDVDSTDQYRLKSVTYEDASSETTESAAAAAADTTAADTTAADTTAADTSHAIPFYKWYMEQVTRERNTALLIANSIFSSQEQPLTISAAKVSSGVTALADILVNALANVRGGDSKRNSAIKDHLDPVFGTYSVVAPSSKTRSAAVIFHKNNHLFGMPEKIQHILALDSAKYRKPKLFIHKDIRGIISSDFCWTEESSTAIDGAVEYIVEETPQDDMPEDCGTGEPVAKRHKGIKADHVATGIDI